MPYRSEQIAGKIGNCQRFYFVRLPRGPAKSQMTFDLQTILVQDQTFHLFNHAQKVTQLLALEYAKPKTNIKAV
jgi:hypothetical protein